VLPLNASSVITVEAFHTYFKLMKYTFRCSSGTGTSTQNVWSLHCVLQFLTDPIGTWKVLLAQSL